MRVSGIFATCIIIFLLHQSAAKWDLRELSSLVRDIANQHNVLCFVVVQPRNIVSQDVFRIVKSLHTSSRFRLIKVVPFFNTAKGCSQILIILLTWLPHMQEDFGMFTKTTKISMAHEPIVLLVLPSHVPVETILGAAYMPFPIRIVYAEQTGISVEVRQLWRVAPGYGIRTAPFAIWTLEQGLICELKFCSFHLRKDLEGVPLRASTRDDMPLSGSVQEPNGDLSITGYFGDIYYELMEDLNATAMVVPNPENVTGSGVNGTWNGIIGMMTRNETDLAVGPITVQPALIGIADYLRPLLRTNYQVFFKQDGTVLEWDAFLKPFGKFVWRIILLWFLAGGVALNFFYRIGVQYREEDGLYTPEFSKINSFLIFFRAFCQQGCHIMPLSLSCRSLYLTTYLMSAIMITAYSAALISKLTLQEPMRPFDSLEAFLKDGTYKLTAIAASTDYSYFSEASEPTLSRIYDRLMSQIPFEDLPLGKEEGLGLVCGRSKTALFITSALTKITAKEMAISHKCHILHFQKELGTVFLTIGIRKNMPYATIINNRVQVMVERGITRRLKTKEWPLHGQVEPPMPPPQVELQQVAQMYGILLIGFAASIIVLAIEKWSVTPLGVAILKCLQKRTGITLDGLTIITFSLVAVAIIITLIAAFV